ncbi:MAG: hypothetical protein LBV20_03825 [Treponema sp.]|jgi:hypothetical protein|nr:hypothetical protein [Treponema sp.]
MNDKTWKDFCVVKEKYRSYTNSLVTKVPELKAAQEKIITEREGGSYQLETPIVFNKALDEITEHDEIKMILVADNPGKREQEAINQRYLVGNSGKLADGFFRKNPELGIDFRKNVIILNKTPIHTARTIELKKLIELGGSSVLKAEEDSQREMAELLYQFQKALGNIPVWIIGYSEMKKKGLFEIYTEMIKSLYPESEPLRNKIFLYRHFSMNQFTIDLNQKKTNDENTEEALTRIGEEYRMRILGW